MSALPDGTLYAELYGSAVTGLSPVTSDSEDLFSLFVARSSALGWLTDPAGARPGGLWGMNDSGLAPAPVGLARSARSARSAWFQVTLGGAPVTLGPLPVQPFLVGAADVLGRMGEFQLRAVRLLLPVHLLGQGKRLPARVGALLQDAGWFRGSAARLRTRVSVVVESVDVAGPQAGAVCDWIGRLDQQVVTDLSPVAATDAGPPDIEQRPIDHLWGGPPTFRMRFDASLAEFTPVAIGWCAAILAEACAALGVRTPVLVTVAADAFIE